MEEIVADVLNFAKPVHLATKEEDLREIVEQAVVWCKVKATTVGVLVSSELPAESAMMSVDGLRLQRALANLVTNAIEASPKGQEVLLTLESDPKQAMLTIKDRGTGMDRETLENIFIPSLNDNDAGLKVEPFPAKVYNIFLH